jgi:hypothetical protein
VALKVTGALKVVGALKVIGAQGVIPSEARELAGRRASAGRCAHARARSLASLWTTVLAAVGLPPAAHAQLDHGRFFTVTAEPAKVALGDSVRVHFRLLLNERDILTDTVPRPAGELPAGVRILAVERLRRGADRAFTGTAVVAFFRPGKRELPTFGLPWVQIVTGHRGVITHDPVEIEVASVLPAGNPPLRDIREPDAPPSLAPLWALLGAATVGLVAWLAARRRRRAVAPEPVPVTPPPPPPAPPSPYEAAVARLAAIDLEGWAARGEVERYYEAVADALRAYLEEAEDIPAPERTTTELLWSLPPRLAEGGLRRRLQEVMGEADLVKFAKVRPGPEEAAAYGDRARDLLDRWHRAAPVAEELDAVR